VANNLAVIEAQFGHFGVALALMAQARQLGLEVGPAVTAYFALGEAWVLAQAGRLPESLRLFGEAERLFDEAGLPLGELYTEYADAMLDLRLLPEARVAADRALHEFTDTKTLLMQAEAEFRVARIAFLSGDLQGASEAGTRAVESFRQQQRAGWVARAVVVGVEARALAGVVTGADLRKVRRAAATLERLALMSDAVEGHLAAGRTAAMLGRAPWALESFDRAHLLARRSPTLTRLMGQISAAAAASLRGDRSRSLRHCREGLSDLERHRGRLGSTELRVLASSHGADLGQIALRTLVRSSSPVHVFRWMERTRAAALMTVERSNLAGFADEFDSLRSMQAETLAAGGESPAMLARRSALEQRLRRLGWESSVTTASTPVSTALPDLRESLGDRWLVEYGILDGNILAAVVSGRRVTVTDLVPLSVIRSEVKKFDFTLRALSRRGSSAAVPGGLMEVARTRLRSLRALLIEPLAVPLHRELVVVPVDVLQRVPWSALHDAPVSLSPSASFWDTARRCARPPCEKVLLAAGPQLPGAVNEVRQLGAVHGDGDHLVLCPPDSTVKQVTNALEDVETAHFACHGIIRSDNPMFSSLQLSDGYLTVQELELRGITPRRVVLAACEAAADTSFPGGEVLGFVSALIARGTAGILGSIYPVPDAAAASLMAQIHSLLRRGDPFAKALHMARASLNLDDPADLVNWCGFTAYGAA
jgi:hypothetical protein